MLLLLAPFVCALPSFQGPLIDLKASETRGDQNAFVVTDDGKLGFVGEGATIAILNMVSFGVLDPSGKPTYIVDSVDLAEPTPMALLPYLPVPGSDGTLFVAGGSAGLWSMKICAGLQQATPVACAAYDVLQLDDRSTKLCTDLALTTDGVGTPILAALYAALEGSELRLFNLSSSPPTLYTSTLISLNGASSGEDIAYALAAGPASSHRLYVAGGTAGLLRVDLSASTPSSPSAAVAQGPSYALGGSAYERVRDVAVADTTPNFLYAVLDYGRLVEIDLTNAWSTSIPQTTTLVSGAGGCVHFAHRVAALKDNNNRALIAVGTEGGGVLGADHGAPYVPNGRWDADLGVGIPDPNVPPASYCGGNGITLFKKVVGSAVAQLADCSVPSAWRTLQLRYTPAPAPTFTSYECTAIGASVRPVVRPFTAGYTCPGTPLFVHLDFHLAPWDGTVSSVNPGLTYFSGEGLSAGIPVGPMYVTSTTPPQLVEVPNSISLCAGPIQPTSCSGAELPAGAFLLGQCLGVGHWRDGVDPFKEWFFLGRRKMFRRSSANCTLDLSGCYGDPCSAASTWRIPGTSELGGKGGFALVTLKPCANASGTNCAALPDGNFWDERWWQIPFPVDAQQGTGDFMSGHTDPRVDANQVPLLLHGTLTSSNFGYRIFKMSDVKTAIAACPDGRGDWLANLSSVKLQTHVEFDPSCVFPGPVAGCASGKHSLRNYRSETFAVDAQGQTKWVSALTVGFAANTGDPNCTPQACPCTPVPSCPVDPQRPQYPTGCASPRNEWVCFYHCPMVVLYDVSDADLSPPPPLLRVALGRENGANIYGHALGLRTKSYYDLLHQVTKTYAFVVDIIGKLYVFDVSGSVLFPPGPIQPYPLDPATRLEPVAILTFPVNLFDGLPDTGIDVEIAGDFAYVSLGRGGVAVVDISSPLSPGLLAILDTPGLAEGAEIRFDGTSHTLVVGDTRAGMRLYGE